MKVFVVDDMQMHRDAIKSNLAAGFRKQGIEAEFIECKNGQELLNRIADINTRTDIVTLDIHMPVLDGLSTLIRAKKISPFLNIFMVSSESEQNIGRHSKKKVSGFTEEKKQALLQSVVARVEKGMVEENKINSILEAVSILTVDPIKFALSNGANNYISKPYTPDTVQPIIDHVKKSA